MNDFNLLGAKEFWNPFKRYGFTHSFYNITTDTIIATWVVLIVILLLIVIGRLVFKNKKSRVRYALITATEGFMDLCTQTLGTFNFHHFSFVFALFIFILICNTISLLPYLEEPTADLSTTLALGTLSFLYANYYAIKAQGIKEYIKEFFQPFFIMFPLNVVGKLASIISISFRLFGNMLGGSVIANIYTSSVSSHWVGILANFCGFNLLMAFFFTIFAGSIQAFVFAMLSLTYLSLGIQGEHSEGS
ncbi:MAG: F-type H+-transporting ATPase subunit a [Alteromonas naphthalenivorans]|jgi:F-type H+-transporting ATPase subunit a